MLSRRSFVKGAAMAAVGSFMNRTSFPTAAAAAPPVSRQAPGYFRLWMGDVEITALNDGMSIGDPNILHGATQREIVALLKTAGFALEDGRYPLPINAFLVNTGRGLLLVDTGAGAYFGEKAGRLPENLRAAGYEPQQVDTVLITHMHSDHTMGLVDEDGRPTFPNATVRVHEAEAAYWLGGGADPAKSVPLLKAVAPYQSAGKFRPFAPGEAPAAGVEAEPLAGHTPGHCCYRVRSGGDDILFWGDVVHCLPVQFPRPEVSIEYDGDSREAVAARKALMTSLAEGGGLVGGAHLPFPGVGRLQASGSGYQWWPAPYVPHPLG